MQTLVSAPIPRTHIADLFQKLLAQRMRNEKDMYLIFLLSQDSFHKELSVRLWQTHVHDIGELESVIKRYEGELLEGPVFQSFAPPMPASVSFHDQVRDALEQSNLVLMEYEDALKRDWPIDVRMLLQTHLLHCKEILRRLEVSFLPLQHAS